MKDILAFVLLVILFGTLVLLIETDHIGSDIDELDKYNGYVVVNKYEENFIFDNKLTLHNSKKDTTVNLYMYDNVFNRFSVNDTINIKVK